MDMPILETNPPQLNLLIRQAQARQFARAAEKHLHTQKEPLRERKENHHQATSFPIWKLSILEFLTF